MGKTPKRGKRQPTGKKKLTQARPGYTIIFRRYRTVNGKVLDAYNYGFRAWPIEVKK